MTSANVVKIIGIQVILSKDFMFSYILLNFFLNNFAVSQKNRNFAASFE